MISKKDHKKVHKYLRYNLKNSLIKSIDVTKSVNLTSG